MQAAGGSGSAGNRFKPACGGLAGVDCAQPKPLRGRWTGVKQRGLLTSLFGPDPLGQSHCCCKLLVHVVWSTDRRCPVLGRKFEPWLRSTLTAKAAEAGCLLFATGMADDHVHVLLRLPSTVMLSTVVQKLKGASSYECNRQKLLPGRLQWQRGYWAETFAPDGLLPLIGYVSAQREHHDCEPMRVLSESAAPSPSPEPAAGGLAER